MPTSKFAVQAMALCAVLVAGCADFTEDDDDYGAGSGGLSDSDVSYFRSLAMSAFAANASRGSTSSGTSSTRSADDLMDDGLEPAFTRNVPISATSKCPAGGSIAVSGNVRVSCPDPPATGSCSTSGTIKMSYKSCRPSSTGTVNGTLSLSYSGSGSSVSMKLTGSLTLLRAGSTSGSCSFALTARTSTRSVSGTVCGRPVASRY